MPPIAQWHCAAEARGCRTLCRAPPVPCLRSPTARRTGFLSRPLCHGNAASHSVDSSVHPYGFVVPETSDSSGSPDGKAAPSCVIRTATSPVSELDLIDQIPNSATSTAGAWSFADIKELTSEKSALLRNLSSVRQTLWTLDPGLNQSLMSSGTTVAQLFNQDKWESHRQVERYFEHLLGIPNSTVFRYEPYPRFMNKPTAHALAA